MDRCKRRPARAAPPGNRKSSASPTRPRFRVRRLLLAFGRAAWAVDVTDVRVGQHPGFTRVVFELDDAAGYQISRVENPKEGPSLPGGTRCPNAARAVLLQLRHGQEPRREASWTGRLMAQVTLRKKALRLREMTLVDPFRVVIDVMAPVAPAPKKTPLVAAKPKPTQQVAAAPEAYRQGRGTGGKDPRGCHPEGFEIRGCPGPGFGEGSENGGGERRRSPGRREGFASARRTGANRHQGRDSGTDPDHAGGRGRSGERSVRGPWQPTRGPLERLESPPTRRRLASLQRVKRPRSRASASPRRRRRLPWSKRKTRAASPGFWRRAFSF